MAHEHTGHGPDRMGDCEGCENEYHESIRLESERRRAAAERYRARLDEAEEKIAFLAAGCLNMDRDQLIQKITEVTSERWKAGSWLFARTSEAYDRGFAAGVRSALDTVPNPQRDEAQTSRQASDGS